MIKQAAAFLLCLCVSLPSTGNSDNAAAEGDKVDWQWGVKIPMADGTHLSATLFRPHEQQGPLPCVFTLTPYVADNYHDRGMYFAQHGYVFLTVDVRGRGNSEGKFHPMQEAGDGHDIVEWLARQPYCNGKIAMWGGSYAGMDQWQAASKHPAHLATIVPAAAAMPSVDVPMADNIWSLDELQWLTLVTGRAFNGKVYEDSAFWTERYRRHAEAHLPYQQLDSVLGNPSPTFQEWISHPEPDSYWDAYNPREADYAAIDIPVLTITGQYDGDQGGALEYYRRHMAAAGARARHFLIIGPWDHAQTRTPQAEVGGLKVGAASVLDLNDLHRQWYDWTMKAGKQPEFLKKAVAWYVTGTERWRYADSFAAVTSSAVPLYLTSGDGSANDPFHSGSLETSVPSSAPPDHYMYNPLDGTAAELQASLGETNLREQRDVLRSNGRLLVYHTAPFEKDTEVSGFFALRAWLSIDQPDTDFAAAVYEIAPDGSSLLLAAAQMRARYREGLRTPKLIANAAPLEYRFEHFNFVARRIARGARLRLVIGPPDPIHAEKNYNSGGAVARESGKDARTVTVRLIHDEQHPSALLMPLGATPD
jgi:putative CocE/NonD family hydrolase